MNRQIVGWAICNRIVFFCVVRLRPAKGKGREKEARQRTAGTESSVQRKSEPRGRDLKRQAALRAEIGQHARIAGNNRALSHQTFRILNGGHRELRPRALRKRIKTDTSHRHPRCSGRQCGQQKSDAASDRCPRRRGSKSQPTSVLWHAGSGGRRCGGKS